MYLLACLVADDGLEIAPHGGVGMRAGDGADAVESRADICHPVAQRLIHGVFERSGPRSDGAHLGPEHLHTQHIRFLPLDVDCPHIDAAWEPELGAQRRSCNAMHAGASLRNDASLAPAWA